MHSAEFDRPVFDAYFPGKHAVHWVVPVDMAYIPAAQSTHADAPAAAYDPAAQLPVQVDTERPIELPYSPDAHIAQAVELELTEYVPAEHAVQLARPAADEYVPAAHVAQPAKLPEVAWY